MLVCHARKAELWHVAMLCNDTRSTDCPDMSPHDRTLVCRACRQMKPAFSDTSRVCGECRGGWQCGQASWWKAGAGSKPSELP